MNNKQATDVQSKESESDILATQRSKNEAAIQLLRKWMADESGYDEETWSIAKKVIEENRLSYREKFDD